MSDDTQSHVPPRRCPMCGRMSDALEPFRPFCSSRCKDKDLARWLSGTYAIPGETAEDMDAVDSPPDNEAEIDRHKRH